MTTLRDVRLDDDEPDEEKKAPEASAPAAIPQALFKARTVLIFGEINQRLAERVTATLLALAAENDEPIKLYVNSPGGHVESGDTIHDMLTFIKPKVFVIGTGWVASAGAHIFLGVPKERRLCLPNTRFMLHQPAGGVRGQASDISIEAEEIIKMRARINRVIARETGQTIERVNEDTERNFWMSVEDAKAYGLVGKIITRASDIG
ncbi:MAG TPA: ATP-dependent Clp protease proteolytic subunit [Micropepsaceae bacterium]|nr:ATP-dependent Clp protease proteolytic subunit [Micropepsaceae bacterium]